MSSPYVWDSQPKAIKSNSINIVYNGNGIRDFYVDDISMTAAFDIAYTDHPGRGVLPAVDAILTIFEIPLFLFIYFAHSLHKINGAYTLILKVVSKFSSVLSKIDFGSV